MVALMADSKISSGGELLAYARGVRMGVAWRQTHRSTMLHSKTSLEMSSSTQRESTWRHLALRVTFQLHGESP